MVRIRQAQFSGLDVHIATVARGDRFTLKPKQTAGSVTSLAPVAHACTSCVVAVNGDFFNARTREPIGGVISNGVVVRSPNSSQNQLTIGPDGRISAGVMQWHGQIAVSDGTTMPVAINDPAADSAVLYDGRFGSVTPRRAAIEISLAPMQSIGMRLGHQLQFRVVGAHGPGRAVPAGQVVLSASGSYAAGLSDLQRKFRASSINRMITVRLATDPPARNSLGANHVLLAGGHVVPIDESDSFVYGAHPRTLFGWDAHGRITLMTVGGASPGRRGGVSLPVAARMLLNMGVTNAVNLDGGGSSTFVAHGRVLNNPSDGHPRRVANAWIVVKMPSARPR